jgi:anti-sigma factor (TIGR02949 family)
MLALINLYTCRETLERLNDYVDRELSDRELHLVERHLKICTHCSRKFAFETELLQEMRTKVGRLQVPTDLMTRISITLAEAPVQIDQE